MKYFPEKGYFGRMRIYLKEMHPLANRFVYVLFLFISLLTLLSTIHGEKIQILFWHWLCGILSVFIFLLILRLMDELKDIKIDVELFPTRPLPSGFRQLCLPSHTRQPPSTRNPSPVVPEAHTLGARHTTRRGNLRPARERSLAP